MMNAEPPLPVPEQQEPPADAQTIAALCERVDARLGAEHVDSLRSAWQLAESAHAGQRRRSGEPYIIHPLAVAYIVDELNMDIDSMLAALLHDVIEDTPIRKEEIAGQFGVVVADLVDGVSKLDKLHLLSPQPWRAAPPNVGKRVSEQLQKQFASVQKMALAMSRDLRVIIVKLADRLHNMRTIAALDRDRARRVALETMEIYAPIALRLGMQRISEELEHLGFATLYPMRARRIQAAVAEARGNRRELTERVRSQIEWHLVHKRGFRAQVLGREKSIYSIYRKMQSKRLSFKEIMDVYGFRIIVDDVDTCYRTLGAVHGLYRPRPGNFKDYIAIPKANGYQSLHTVLFGMHGVPVEIQIRTRNMEATAEQGIASHWAYKAGDQSVSAAAQRQRALHWVNGLLELQQRTGADSREFIEHLKADLFPDEIYVFTSRGEVLALPAGASALDFAYAVHTDIGNQCHSCMVNGRLAPLAQTLENGDTVDVVSDRDAMPKPAWLDFLVTAKARAAALHALKQHRREDALALGRSLLDQELQNAFDHRLERVSDPVRRAFARSLGKPDFEDFLADIGGGRHPVRLAARQLMDAVAGTQSPAWQSWFRRINRIAKPEPLVVEGTEGMALIFSQCCHPIPGDGIIGRIRPNRGLVVHTADCQGIRKDRAGEKIALRWSENLPARDFPVEVRVDMEPDRSALATLAHCATRLEANVEQLKQTDRDQRLCLVVVRLRVRDRVHLARVIRGFRAIKAVSKVTRSKWRARSAAADDASA